MFVVLFPDARAGRQFTGCQKSELVMACTHHFVQNSLGHLYQKSIDGVGRDIGHISIVGEGSGLSPFDDHKI